MLGAQSHGAERFLEAIFHSNVVGNPSTQRLFSLENHKRRNCTSVCTNTFQHRHPFLSTRLGLPLCSRFSTNNNPRSLYLSNSKSTFIHIINIFSLDIVLLNHFLECIKPSLQIFSDASLIRPYSIPFAVANVRLGCR